MFFSDLCMWPAMSCITIFAEKDGLSLTGTFGRFYQTVWAFSTLWAEIKTEKGKFKNLVLLFGRSGIQQLQQSLRPEGGLSPCPVGSLGHAGRGVTKFFTQRGPDGLLSSGVARIQMTPPPVSLPHGSPHPIPWPARAGLLCFCS